MGNLCIHRNFWVSQGVAIAIQVTMIFTFLTVFFFAYVVRVEKDEFAKQIELIVDKVMKKESGDPSSYIIGQDLIPKKEAEIMVLGILEQTRRSQEISDKVADTEVYTSNNAIETKAQVSLLYAWGILLFIIIVLYIFGVCTPMKHTLTESLVVVGFVAITEFIFLRIIAARYISASPNQVKREIAQTIQAWIRDNKVIPSTQQNA